MSGQQGFSEPNRPVPTWVDEDDPFTEERSSTFPPDRLVTLRFLRDAVRRHLRIWLVLAIAGLAVGLALPSVMPPPQLSSARLILTHREGDDPQRAMATDVSLATTHTVAERVIRQLDLPVTADVLLKEYTATNLTDRVLEIKASAKTGTEATKLADTVAKTYLAFRKEQIAVQAEPLRDDLDNANREVTAAERAVRAAGDNPADPKKPKSAEVSRLNVAREQQTYFRQQLLDETKAASMMMDNSRMLDAAAPVPASAKRTLVLSAASGLIVGLFLGIGFVVVRALVSDKLWWRQDIAHALGARIRLSIGRPPRRLWWPFPVRLRGRERRHPEVRLMANHLDRHIDGDETPASALAVVAVDDVQTNALVVASLAVAAAEEGKHVLVADLTETGLLAAMLGVKEAGTHESRFSAPNCRIDVFLPHADAAPAEGRYRRPAEGTRPVNPDDIALDAAWDFADLVLTLASPTPAIGADNLSTWAARAAVVVTAGQSTATRIHATGEMLRLAGVRIETAIVLRADRTDEGVGVPEADDGPTHTPDVEMFLR
jgi:capsular polysaccharide biosynthesis protein